MQIRYPTELSLSSHISGKSRALSSIGGSGASHLLHSSLVLDRYPASSVTSDPSTISYIPNSDTILDMPQPMARPIIVYGAIAGSIASASAGLNWNMPVVITPNGMVNTTYIAATTALTAIILVAFFFIELFAL